MLLGAARIEAVEEDLKPVGQPPATSTTTNATSSPRIPVAQVLLNRERGIGGDGISAGLGNLIRLHVSALSSQQIAAAKSPEKVILFIDDLALRKLCRGSAVETDGDASFILELERTDSTRTNWALLMGSPSDLTWSPHGFVRQATCAIGFDEGGPQISTTNTFNLIVLPNRAYWSYQPIAVIFVIAGVIGLAIMVAGQKKLWALGQVVVAILTLLLSWLLLGHFWSWALIFGFFIIGFLWLSNCTELLRDSGPVPPKDKHRPYSLARFQMAIWFFLVITAYVFLWFMNQALDTITATVLALMGIGTGTALGAHAQDSNKSAKLAHEKQDLEAKANRTLKEQERLETLKGLLAETSQLETEKKRLERLDIITKELEEIANGLQILRQAANPSPNEAAETTRLRAKETILQQEQAKLEAQKPADLPAGLSKVNAALESRISKGFMEDILTDSVGMSFHRYQMFVWTIVLAVIFIAEVYRNLAMPEFNATLLALMGISSGTYLGFMIAEPPAAEQSRKP